MSTFTITARPSNGVSFGFTHKVLSGEASNASVFLFDFGPNAPNDCYLVANIMVLRSGVSQSLSSAKISYPAPGQVQFDCASSFSPSAGDLIQVIAQRDTGDGASVSSAYADENPTFTDQAPNPKVFAIN